MEYIAVVILLALIQYIVFAANVGFTREKYGVPAPKTIGNEVWERIYRVQQNTLEQLIIFIPSMLTFGMYVSELWALLPGVVFIVGRQVYAHLYVKNPSSRGPGMVLSFFSNIALVVGSLIGLGMKLLG